MVYLVKNKMLDDKAKVVGGQLVYHKMDEETELDWKKEMCQLD